MVFLFCFVFSKSNETTGAHLCIWAGIWDYSKAKVPALESQQGHLLEWCSHWGLCSWQDISCKSSLRREEGVSMQCLALCSMLMCRVGGAGWVWVRNFYFMCAHFPSASSSHSQLPLASPFGAGIGLKVKSQLPVIWLLSEGGQRVGQEC